MTPEVNGETAAWLTGGVTAFITCLLWLRRRTSRDGLEVIKDRTEGKMLQTAIEERDKAMAQAADAWSQRTDDAATIARLGAENEYLKRELAAAQQQLADIRTGVMAVGRKVDETKSNLDEVERRTGRTDPAPLGKE